MKDLEKDILEYLKERGWDNLNPSDLVKSISIEAAELLEIFQWESASIEEVKNNSEKMKELRDEIPDVIIYCLELSVLLGLDSEKMIREKLEKAKKKYPAELMKIGDSGSGRDKAYWQIKKKHRIEKLSDN